MHPHSKTYKLQDKLRMLNIESIIKIQSLFFNSMNSELAKYRVKREKKNSHANATQYCIFLLFGHRESVSKFLYFFVACTNLTDLSIILNIVKWEYVDRNN